MTLKVAFGFFGDDDGHDDPRFLFSVGQKVRVKPNFGGEYGDEWAKMWVKDPRGHVGIIQSRRNAYPPPAFEGYWVPIYWVSDLGDIGEATLEAA